MSQQENHSGKILDFKTLRRIFVFVKPHLRLFYLILFLTLFKGLMAPLLPFLIRYTVDDYIMVGDLPGLNQMALLLVAVILIQALLDYFHAFLSGDLGQRVVKDVRTEVFRHIIGMRLQYFDRTPIGRLVTRNVSDIESLSDIFTNGLANIIGDLLQIIFILLAMFWLDWRLTLVTLSVLPILIISTYIFKEKIKAAFNDVRNAVSNLNSFVQEHITGMYIVQIFNSEDREYQKFSEINKAHRSANIRTVLYYSIYFPVAEVVTAAGTGLLVWYGARQVLGGEIELGVLIAFLMFLAMFFRPVRLIADRFNALQMGVVSSDRILKLLDTEAQIESKGTFAPSGIQGKVDFKSVWFAYDLPEYVLKDVSFSVKAGQTVALVGATGAGKSSIINLITRFYDIQKGRILIDDRPIAEYDLTNLRTHIGMVLQDVFLFSGSILDNITLHNPSITLEQAQRAADLVGARAFIERLPGGFHYKVMERGATLSVGQRQLISFVRAMVYDPKILILDEATSSVDGETEALIQNAIEQMMQGRTSIVIAHRLATIQKADQIIVLDKGQIKEIGTHQSLLAEGGIYAHLHDVQYRQLVE
ncbi:MAG: ABC transporter ATP-binding protein [Bernardetiaceae bacterium]